MSCLNVLVVEDDPIQRKTLDKLLSNLGQHCVLDAASLLEAAYVIKGPSVIDGAIVDLVLEDGSGLEVAKLCADHGIPVVFCTSTQDGHNSRLMWELGFVMPKPVLLPMLDRVVDYFLAVKARRNQ